MRRLAGAFEALAVGEYFSNHALGAPHTRRGVKSNKYPMGARGKFAPFNSEADAGRAVTRAKRWLKNKSKGPLDRPPSHIYQNAELAVAQFGDDIAKLCGACAFGPRLKALRSTLQSAICCCRKFALYFLNRLCLARTTR